MRMFSPFVDLDGTPIPSAQILGYGRTGLVIRREDIAIKIPIRWSKDTDTEYQINVETIQREHDVYRRIGDCPGVVPCIGYSGKSIELALMENGDLRTYLSQSDSRPPKTLQLSWFCEMARALAHIHDRRVLVADVATRNFPLDSELSIKLCDFTESTILPLGSCMETVDDEGYTIHTDIGQLGAVMYEVVTGEHCEFDLFKNEDLSDSGRAVWPRREDLPCVEGVWLGWVMDRCWCEGSFRNAHELARQLEVFRGEVGGLNWLSLRGLTPV